MRSLFLFVGCCLAAAALPLEFKVSFRVEQFDGPFSGRAVVYLSKQRVEPRFGPFWFNPQPTYSVLANGVGPGEAIVVGGTAIGFPGRIDQLAPGEYTVQAVLDRNLGGRSIGTSPGNLYSAPVRMNIDPSSRQAIRIVCDRFVEDQLFQDTERVRAARLSSKLLSDFYQRNTNMRAAVVLPASWKNDGNKTYPVLYEIPGFGGSFLDLSGSSDVSRTSIDGVEFIYVVLDPNCPTGHHVFADSANNGPWGKALVTEFIPYIEKKFRGVGKPHSRFVTGHSSGGWSSLWLQVTYPEFFGGCWSTSPDPVDFRDFSRIDVYRQGANAFTDESGKPRPIARMGDTPALYFKQFSDMEQPIRGEQLGSFEAVFSPRGANGQPARLWDRITGAIDPTIAKSWQKYDIGLILRSKWKELEPKLKGKIHVYMGSMDTFYLEGAVKLLKRDMAGLGSDAAIELFPGDHGSVMTRELRERISKEIAAQARRGANETR
jgi:S-formylglutathione hydrolase FrmB